MNTSSLFEALPDDDLLAETKRLAGCERAATAALLRSLMEVDSRRLYLREGCSSLFTYCTQVLHLAEGAAYNRIEAARAARRFPVILQALASGSVSLTTVRLLAPHLTDDNHRELLEAAHHQSKREIELLVAALNPKPPAATMIRKLPSALVTALAPGTRAGDGGAIGTVEQLAPSVGDHEPSAGVSALRSLESSRDSLDPPRTMVEIRTDHQGPTGQPRTTLSPLSSQHYKLQLTISRDTHDKLRRAQDLFRHTMPHGDVAALLDRALALLLADLERRRCAATPAPRATATRAGASRHIPAAVRRQVWQRDQGQCAFVGTSGRCRETGFLEFHHVEPYAEGGPATVENIELRCRAHNLYEASLFFGSRVDGVRESAAAGW